MKPWKLEYMDAVLFDTLIADVCKAANPKAAFIFLIADWLYPTRAEIRKTVNFHFCCSV